MNLSFEGEPKIIAPKTDEVTCSKIENCIHIPEKLIPIILEVISDYKETESIEDFEETARNLKYKLQKGYIKKIKII